MLWFKNKLNPEEFKISEEEAIEIANRNENLKSDFYRRSKENITYLYFQNCEAKLVEIQKIPYWQIQVLDGKISGIEFKDEGTRFWDGYFGKEELKQLRCLINAQTGEYQYYPKN